ncbi:MAG: hypothetical protein CO150_03270 [Nitrospirae bacterium CG_4_9_14_3_um_filter_53_35]|nr:MAG: hypothetical protein AUK29_09340 [Nitrospirae bacterium CG2_30_53_67]PIS37624.1 MAG: hypothetical protein COT35_04895 [Nitrospirae bacterium CG08_land_8_20_14_0_20_52_24]PIV85405.1 MAG: hypothetical protein COW52_02400 [Nitrospirae bacterium CG17_big_fil_post_rev_8_21_14_2_50_50_9]PIW86000.1 MAG: hypothetical protein COZ95_01420 [Nitrospirae bacterium CG_4_8_14_3_um_filter_50_41]PIX86214.1 MAG: hypothetical protein COZ32_04485 [Nitrospirae bacterium CG_4_10_14_3_um_filter_53_41]PJA7635
MKKEELLSRITIDPDVLVGKPTIRGLRISVEQIIKALAHSIPVKELLEEYPELEPADIQAALLYAAEIISEERVFELK